MDRRRLLPLFVALTVLPVAAHRSSPSAAVAADIGKFPAARLHRTGSEPVSPLVHAIRTGVGAQRVVFERA